MWSIACRKAPVIRAAQSLKRLSDVISVLGIDAWKFGGFVRSYAAQFFLEDAEDGGESAIHLQKKDVSPISLAKSLACLPDEPSTPEGQRNRKRVELKRLIELRIKKKVKALYLNGKFYHLMDKVIASADTLQDCYDIIRLNSNVDMASEKDDLCFLSMAEELRSGDFDVKSNTVVMMRAKSGRRESLVLPRLKLKVIQEAIRTVLEVVYRPYFSKISHGCRSGRGHHSALRYICKEIHNHDWWFTLCMNKEADSCVLSKLLSVMEEKIDDTHLLNFLQLMFDARVLNLVFGGFPKGHGLPQEGVLSPVLMNIHLDIFDREAFRISMKYEGLGPESDATKDFQQSKLRHWVRRQMKDRRDNNDRELENGTELRLYVCRYMDEVFVSVAGSRDVALSIKAEFINYLNSSLYIDVEDRTDLLAVKSNTHGLQFLGKIVRVSTIESDAVKAVHKLKNKVQLFASQKQEIWDGWTVRIGKKWLAYGLKRIKESEIKQLGLSTPMLDHIAQFRKEGMKTDHWFKSLIKIWMQDVNANVEADEETVLSKYIAEPALPQDLRESFYNFQKQAWDYISSETAATLALLPNSSADSEKTVTKTEAPITYIKKSLHRYGLTNIEGFSKHVPTLVLQDDILIVNWFSGLIRRWLKWYSEFDNFGEIKLLIVNCVRKSCIRTLAAKYRIHESLIERRFESEMSCIPVTEDLEMMTMASDTFNGNDEALMYGISYSGLCVLSLSRVKVPTRVFNCFVMGCTAESPSMYTLHVKERQRFPGWHTGFSTSIHSSLNGRRIGLCNHHVKDLYIGHISLQSIEFGALSK